MFNGRPEISVIIPVYNEEKTLGSVVNDLLKLNSEIPSMEVIVVDDCSTDKTQEETMKFPLVRYVKHKKNLGKGAAIKTGATLASGKILVIQDADLEYPVTHIPDLIKPICSGQSDVVYGSRFKGNSDGMKISHRLGNIILSKLASLLYSAEITDIMTGHKALSTKVFNSLNLKEKGFAIEIELTSKILKSGWKILEIPIEYSYRKNGCSKISYLDGLKSLLKLLLYKVENNTSLT
jgi:glycosyltransferase involved in cell wall biosynthesis